MKDKLELQRIGVIITAVGVIIAAIALILQAIGLIPEFGQWLFPREPLPTDTPVPTINVEPVTVVAGTTPDTPTSTMEPTDTPTPTVRPPTPTFTYTPTPTPVPTPTDTPGPLTYFEEKFSSAIPDTQRWQIFENGGTIVPLNPGLQLQSNSYRFPFLISQGNPFPAAGDFEVEILFRYSSATGYGTGITMGSCCPKNGAPMRDPHMLLSIWQDSRGFRVVKWNYTALPDEIFFQGKGSMSFTSHQAVIRYSADNNITVSIDGRSYVTDSL